MPRSHLLCLVLSLSTCPAAAQTVRGRVFDSETNTPIALTAISLLRADNSVERQVLSGQR
ncbi:MAG: hypothetical protein ACRENP_28775 [Longimicrobiales bacterium]